MCKYRNCFRGETQQFRSPENLPRSQEDKHKKSLFLKFRAEQSRAEQSRAEQSRAEERTENTTDEFASYFRDFTSTTCLSNSRLIALCTPFSTTRNS